MYRGLLCCQPSKHRPPESCNHVFDRRPLNAHRAYIFALQAAIAQRLDNDWAGGDALRLQASALPPAAALPAFNRSPTPRLFSCVLSAAAWFLVAPVVAFLYRVYYYKNKQASEGPLLLGHTASSGRQLSKEWLVFSRLWNTSSSPQASRPLQGSFSIACNPFTA